jgi:hypothetical protein
VGTGAYSSRMPAWIALARHLGTASLSGVIAGVVVGGLLGRVFMRISGFMAGPALVGVTTENGNRVGDVTVAGTIGLVVFVGVGFGLLGGVLYALVEPSLRRLRPWHGVAYGVGLLAALGFTTLDPANFDFTRFGVPALNVAMFAALFVIFGVATGWLFDAIRTLRAGTGRAARAVDILAWLALLPAGLLLMLFVGGAAGLEPPAAILVLAVLLVPAIVRWRGLPRAIGYASLAGVVLLGAARTLSGLPSLFRGF